MQLCAQDTCFVLFMSAKLGPCISGDMLFMLIYLVVEEGNCNVVTAQPSPPRSSVGPLSFSAPESSLGVICSTYSLSPHTICFFVPLIEKNSATKQAGCKAH